MKYYLAIWIGALFLSNIGFTKPKYGPEGKPVATPLSVDNAFFREAGNPAPDFWSLIGFYVPQQNKYSCSAASVTMTLNAALGTAKKTAEDEVISQGKLVEAIKVENWKERVNAGGYNGQYGLELDQLGRVVKAAFEAHTKEVIVTVRHADATPKFRVELIKNLEENEKSATNFLISNFDQQIFTDDSQAGHIAPIGAYDAKRKRVLILDPDREYYEPYWVSLDHFIAGMNTTDKGAKATRGYVFVSFKAR